MHSLNRLAAIAFTCCLLLVANSANASEGDLYPQFGVRGFALTKARNHYPYDPPKPVVQRDGKILVCIALSDWGPLLPLPQDMLISRFNNDGSLDSSFGVDGEVAVDFGGRHDGCRDMVQQEDGKIVVAGTSYSSSTPYGLFAIARLRTDGTLDPTFGGGDGKVLLAVGADDDASEAERLQLQPDGKIIIAGDVTKPSYYKDFAIIRLLPDGRLDSTFGSNGTATVAFILAFEGSASMRAAYLYALSLDSDGRILLGGLAFGDTPVTAMARLTPDGQLDSTFATNGRATAMFDAGTLYGEQIYDFALQPDGCIVMAVRAFRYLATTYKPAVYNLTVARLRPDGILDPAFGEGGRVVIAPLGDDGDIAHSVLIQPDGRILIAGNLGTHPATFRLTRDGELDTSYGVFGRIEYALPASMDGAFLSGIIMHAGHIYVSGSAYRLLPPDPKLLSLYYSASFVAQIESPSISLQHSPHALPAVLSPPFNRRR